MVEQVAPGAVMVGHDAIIKCWRLRIWSRRRQCWTDTDGTPAAQSRRPRAATAAAMMLWRRVLSHAVVVVAHRTHVPLMQTLATMQAAMHYNALHCIALDCIQQYVISKSHLGLQIGQRMSTTGQN